MFGKKVEQYEDRRAELRTPKVLAGEIVFDYGYSKLDCLVRNDSDHGCRLGMASTAGLPDQFVLRIKQDGRRFQARVKWRNSRSVGVEIDDANFGSTAQEHRARSATPET